MTPCIHRGWAAAAVLLVVGLGLVGCGSTAPSEAPDADPAQVKPVAGTDLNRVTLSEQALQSLGIETARVGAVTTSARRKRSAATATESVPLTAVIYDPNGVSWVYTIPAPRTYLRARIVIDHTTSDVAYLSSGPPVGTPVVTVGTAELLGSEYGVGGL